MALIRCNFFSDVLGLSTSMTVLLPQPADRQIGTPGSAVASEPARPPVLYLLHGLSDDDSIWLRHTNIERYAAPLGLAVVMPAAQRSFYLDEESGLRYWTFLSQELPELVGRFFRVSQRREDTFVAGLSMGGYGALRWALRQPERFAAAASLSGALDVAARSARNSDDWPRLTGGRDLAGTDDDPFALLERADPATLPRLFATCGTEDQLYPDTERLRAVTRAAGIELAGNDGPGIHDWAFWDAAIQDVLGWLPLPLPLPPPPR